MESSDHSGGAETACPACNQLSPAGARFCNFCGHSMTPQAAKAICPRCYRDNEPGARYCNFCGAAISMDAAPNPHVAPAPGMHPYAPQQYAGYVPRSMGVGTVIGKGFGTYFRNFLPFSFLSIVVGSPVLAYTIYLIATDPSADTATTWDTIGTNLLRALAWLLAALLTYGTFKQLSGHHVGFGAAVRGGLRRCLPAFAVGLLQLVIALLPVAPAIIAEFAGADEGVIGLFILVGFVPAIMLWCATWVSVPAAVVERRGIWGSIERSMELTRGSRWAVFAVNLLTGLIQWGIVTILVGVVAGFDEEFSSVDELLKTELVLYSFLVLYSGVQAVVAAVGYFELRSSKENIQVEELASVFD